MKIFSIPLFCLSLSVNSYGQDGAARLLYDAGHGTREFQGLTKIRAEVGFSAEETSNPLNKNSLQGIDVLYLRTPNQNYSNDEISAVIDHIKNGGSLFLVMDEERRTPLNIGVNQMLAPFEMKLSADTVYLHNCGAIAKKGDICVTDRELPYSGGRTIEGGTPFVWRLDEDGNQAEPCGAYRELENGAKTVVMGEGMAALLMGTPNGQRLSGVPRDPANTTYWGKDSQRFLTEVFRWLFSEDRVTPSESNNAELPAGKAVDASPIHRFSWIHPIPDSFNENKLGLQHRSFFSKIHDSPISYVVYLPSGYDSEKAKRISYPIQYSLHGASGMPKSGAITHYGMYAKIINRLSEEGRITPPVIVWPNGGLATQYEDFRDGELRLFSCFRDELFPYIENNYRIDSSQKRIDGFSMGGLGAMKFGLRMPGEFLSVTTWGGALLDMENPDLAPRPSHQQNQIRFLYKGDIDYIRKTSIQRLVQTGKAPKNLQIRLIIGSNDEAKLLNQRYFKVLQENNVKSELITVPGAEHRYGDYLKVWEEEIIRAYGVGTIKSR